MFVDALGHMFTGTIDPAQSPDVISSLLNVLKRVRLEGGEDVLRLGMNEHSNWFVVKAEAMVDWNSRGDDDPVWSTLDLPGSLSGNG